MMVQVDGQGLRCARCEAPFPPREPVLPLLKQWPHFPFCSDRCRMVDLGLWLTEAYRVPGAPVPAEGDSRPEDVG